MSNISGAKERAIELLGELDDEDSFTLVVNIPTDDGGGDNTVQTYSPKDKKQIDHLNHTANLVLFMSQHYGPDYPLDQVAQDVLKTARLQAQGGQIGE